MCFHTPHIWVYSNFTTYITDNTVQPLNTNLDIIMVVKQYTVYIVAYILGIDLVYPPNLKPYLWGLLICDPKRTNQRNSRNARSDQINNLVKKNNFTTPNQLRTLSSCCQNLKSRDTFINVHKEAIPQDANGNTQKQNGQNRLC